MEIEVGKLYRTRGGLKVGPMVNIPDSKTYIWDDGTETGWRNCGSVGTPGCNSAGDLIAEWTDQPTGKTLKELDVKPGDVVALAGAPWARHTLHHMGREGRWYTGELEHSYLGLGPDWHIVSRANQPTQDTPTTWGDMTDAEQDAIAGHAARGGEVEYLSRHGINAWIQEDRPNWRKNYCFRIRKEPVRGVDTLWRRKGSWFRNDGLSDVNTQIMTIPTLDGQPIPGTYTNEAGDVIVMEELGDE